MVLLIRGGNTLACVRGVKYIKNICSPSFLWQCQSHTSPDTITSLWHITVVIKNLYGTRTCERDCTVLLVTVNKAHELVNATLQEITPGHD